MSLVDKVSGITTKDKQPLVEEYLNHDEKRLLHYARAVDRLDRFLGPLESTLQLYGSPFWQGVGVVLEVSELAVLKLPFIISYLKNTQDYDALYSWLPREIFAGIVPYGDFIDISQAYYNRARNYYEKKALAERRALS